MKKRLFFILLFSLFLLTTTSIKADMGPKPSAEIEVIGIDQDFSFDLLRKSRDDVEVLLESEYEDLIDYRYYQEEFPLEVLNGYRDSDGFVSSTLYQMGAPFSLKRENTTKNIFRTGYHSPPKEFKIAIILSDGTLITSKRLEARLFHAEIVYDLSDVNLTSGNLDGVGVINQDLPVSEASLELLKRVVITVAIELIILALFFYKKFISYKKVALINVITQTILTIFMLISYYFWDPFFGVLFILFIGELIVFTVEAIIYFKVLKEHKPTRAILYAIVANSASLILGIILSMT